MMDPESKKKSTNLRLIEIINSQKYNEIKVIDPNTTKFTKSKPYQKHFLKGKKIDNKSLKIKNRKGQEADDMFNQIVQLTNNNTHTQSISNVETLPFRQRSRHNKSRNDFSQATHSICTFDVNEQIEKGRRFSHHYRRASDARIQWNKENSRSQSRNSLGFDRKMSLGRKIHNRSCHDIQFKDNSRKNSREKRRAHLSCTQQRTKTNSPEKKKKTPKKHKRASTSMLKNPTVKNVVGFKKSILVNQKNKKKTHENKVLKKKEPKIKKQIKQAKIKKTIEVKQASDQQDLQYPVSKYVSHHKQSKDASQNITIRNSLCQHLFSSNSSLIKSIQTPKRWTEDEINNQVPIIDIGECSLNLKQIRKFQQNNQKSEEKLKKNRRKMYSQIAEEYPELQQSQIQFLSSIILIQRWWREKQKKRNEQPDRNLTVMIKNILNNAIKSQQVSPNNELAQTIKPRPAIDHTDKDKKKFFSQQNEIDVPQVSLNQHPSPVDSSLDIDFGDLQIPETKIKKQFKNQRNIIQKNILKQQVFPPFQLLKQQRNQTLKRYSNQNNSFNQEQQINQFDTLAQKQKMRRQIRELDTDTKQIQKGFLAYLNCLKNVKTTSKSKSLLRKVNSSEGLMHDLYKKAFKMQESIQQSQSVEELAKKVLIRKEWCKKQIPLIHIGSDPSSPVHLSSFLPKDKKRQKLQDFMGKSSQNVRNRSSNIISLNQILQQYKNQSASEELSEDYQSQIMASLLKQDLNQQGEVKVNEVTDMVLELIYLEFAEDIEQTDKVKSKFVEILTHRHIPGIDCSDTAIKYYLNLIAQQFITNYKPALVKCLNTPIGFSSASILKLMREPEFVPSDGYYPPVDSKAFFNIQKVYLQRIDFHSIYKKYSELVQGLINIHNKAVYQCFLSEIQLLKPNGEGGLIHPWDPPRIVNHAAVEPQHLYLTLMEAMLKVTKYCSFKAGLILENWVTRNARELQKAYQQNEQRIVSMITFDLEEEELRWGDVDEFLLQVRLDMDVLVLQWLLVEATFQISNL